jgi:hypothetical protein
MRTLPAFLLALAAALTGCEPEPTEYADCDLPRVGDLCTVPLDRYATVTALSGYAICDGLVEVHEPSPGIDEVWCIHNARRHLVGSYTDIDGYPRSVVAQAPDGQHLARCEVGRRGGGIVTHVWREIDTDALECRPAN